MKDIVYYIQNQKDGTVLDQCYATKEEADVAFKLLPSSDLCPSVSNYVIVEWDVS